MITTKQDYFKQENIVATSIERSPSGKYKLIIDTFETGKNTWNYTRGTVLFEDKIIAVVQRNYSSFPFLWIEGHKNGHDYLLCGANYQGQTILELDTQQRKDVLPPEAETGAAFCWADIEFNRDNCLLIVCGCYWAAPYEYRFYDLSDPLNNGPQELIIEGKDSYIDYALKPPVVSLEGLVTVFQTMEDLDFETCFKDKDPNEFEWHTKGENKFVVLSSKTYKIKDGKLIFVEEWTLDAEKTRRQENEISRLEYKKWRESFIATDVLYNKFIECCKTMFQIDAPNLWSGYTHSSWCKDKQFDESRWGLQVYKDDNCSIEIEWAIKTGPVKLTFNKKGEKSIELFWYEHTSNSIKNAFHHAKYLLSCKY